MIETGKKLRLVAGTINAWPDDAEWRNYTLDICPREIWDRDLPGPIAPDFVADLADFDFKAETFDEIRAHHVLEHMTYPQAAEAVGNVWRLLKPGGVFDVEVPDMDAVAAAWHTGDHSPEDLQQWIYGEQLSNHTAADSHRYGWTEPALREILTAHSFTVGNRYAEGLALRFTATKGR